MIIDIILDRKDGLPYSPKEFYNRIMQYGDIAYPIADAMDGGTEEDIKRELCAYVHNNDYNPEIAEWVNNVQWLNN